MCPVKHKYSADFTRIFNSLKQVKKNSIFVIGAGRDGKVQCCAYASKYIKSQTLEDYDFQNNDFCNFFCITILNLLKYVYFQKNKMQGVAKVVNLCHIK